MIQMVKHHPFQHLPKWCAALGELVEELGCGLLRVDVGVDVVAVHESTLRQ